jgi:alginate O-acetyltransferase complex protein AlgI
VQRGIALCLSGLIKKMVFADRFALISDSYFNNLALHPGWLAAWTGGIAFTLQIYFDFSGYTDIARGCAKLLGFEFPLNFERPYLSRNIAEFWTRWHMTLSFWVRDYLFLPLTRKLHSVTGFYVSIMITMLAVGLWHGASWNFVLWGAYAGLLLVIYYVVDRIGAGKHARWFGHPSFIPFKVLLTYLTFVFGGVLFRTMTMNGASFMFKQLFNASVAGQSMLTAGTIALALIAFTLSIFEERIGLIRRLSTAPIPIQIPAYAVLFLALELFSVTDQKIPFIYFQF